MMIRFHSQATTPPKIRVRAALQASSKSAFALAKRYDISELIVYKWQHSHIPLHLQMTLSPVQEVAGVSLRKILFLPLDNLLAVVREFLNPTVSRSGLARCLRSHGHGVGNWGEKQKAFKSYESNYLHDVKYLPHRLNETSRRFLRALNRACSMAIHLHSGEEHEITPYRYVWLYNQKLPQLVLLSGLSGLKTPLQSMKDWYTGKPELKRNYTPFRDLTPGH